MHGCTCMSANVDLWSCAYSGARRTCSREAFPGSCGSLERRPARRRRARWRDPGCCLAGPVAVPAARGACGPVLGRGVAGRVAVPEFGSLARGVSASCPNEHARMHACVRMCIRAYVHSSIRVYVHIACIRAVVRTWMLACIYARIRHAWCACKSVECSHAWTNVCIKE